MKRHFTKIVMTLVTLLSTPSTFAQTPDNVPSYFIANGTSPALAESKTLAHLVFVSQAAGNNVTDIFHTASGDAGKTWSTAVSISNTPGMSTEPSIAVESNGSLDAVWTDTSTSDKTPDIFFARSTDNGKTWTQPKDIANTPGKSSDPKIVVGKNNSLHVVWCDTSKGTKNRDLYYSSSN
jgi:Neuraminidase (sialidase)